MLPHPAMSHQYTVDFTSDQFTNDAKFGIRRNITSTQLDLKNNEITLLINQSLLGDTVAHVRELITVSNECNVDLQVSFLSGKQECTDGGTIILQGISCKSHKLILDYSISDIAMHNLVLQFNKFMVMVPN